MEGERSSKAFFARPKKGQKSIEISELLDQGSQLRKDQDGIAEMAMSFLRNLLTSNLLVNPTDMDRILKGVKKRIPEANRRKLEVAFTLEPNLR